MRKRTLCIIFGIVASTNVAHAQTSHTILFIGNSFTYGELSPVLKYRANTVTDLNGTGVGGVPALFKSFTDQAGLSYDVYLETRGGAGFEYHLENKLDVIGRRAWDVVVMQGQSMLDNAKPGNPAKFLTTSRDLANVFQQQNRNVQIHLMATWSRADQTYTPNGAWHGQPIEAMARDIRVAIDSAAKLAPGVKSVLPVGEAWTRAMKAGFADPNPYDGIETGKVDLWATDNYHASAYGYYLEALIVFGAVTNRDPRSLGKNECSGLELGFTPSQVTALEGIAFDQLAEAGGIKPIASKAQTAAHRCVSK